jgi:hypothetical protein
MSAPSTKTLGLHLAQLTSTTTLALILGSTTWTSLSVIPSIIAAPLSTHNKLSVFDGLINRGNAVLRPVFILAGSSLGYLTCQTSKITGTFFSFGNENGTGRNLYGVGLLAMIASLALQSVVVPKNNAIQAMVRWGEGKDDTGEEGNTRIGELNGLNWIRVILSGIAFGVSVVEMTS